VLGQKHRAPTWLGEQVPHGPQSESTRQLLAATQTLAAELDSDGRQSHGTLPGQSGSLPQAS
jgi:hypothetical protein